MNELDIIRERFTETTSRIAQFWGFPRALGAVYGALYLAPVPLSLDELVVATGVTKGAVSTHVRALGRLQMVHRHVQLGDRKDYYVAETRLWTVVRNVLTQRRQGEFDQALSAVGELANRARELAVSSEEAERRTLYADRLQTMQSFFGTLDSIVGAILALDELRLAAATRAISTVLGRRAKPSGEHP